MARGWTYNRRRSLDAPLRFSAEDIAMMFDVNVDLVEWSSWARGGPVEESDPYCDGLCRVLHMGIIGASQRFMESRASYVIRAELFISRPSKRGVASAIIDRMTAAWLLLRQGGSSHAKFASDALRLKHLVQSHRAVHQEMTGATTHALALPTVYCLWCTEVGARRITDRLKGKQPATQQEGALL